jgi:hypothetical protein
MTDMQSGHLDATTLDRYRTGELELAEHERVAAHLESCVTCARSLGELEAFAGAVGRAYAARRAIDAREEPDWPRLRSRIADRTAAERREILEAARPAARRSAWVRWAPQAAAAVLALVVIGILWREGVREPEDARELVQPAPEIAGTDRPEEDRPQEEIAAAAGPPAQERRTAEGLADDERFRQTPLEPPPAEPSAAAPAAKALPPPEAERADAANEAVARRANAADPPRDEAREEDLAAAADRLEVQALVRFELQGRDALVRSDTLAAARALELWRDSLAARTDLPLERRDTAGALADSLAELAEPARVPPE